MISKEEIDNLANLARLELSDAEKGALAKDISNILEYVGQVSAVAIEGGRPTAPAQRNVMRDDTTRAEGDTMLDKEKALRSAFPKREGSFNVVRKIIQKDE